MSDTYDVRYTDYPLLAASFCFLLVKYLATFNGRLTSVASQAGHTYEDRGCNETPISDSAVELHREERTHPQCTLFFSTPEDKKD